jgi:hypothetical protein
MREVITESVSFPSTSSRDVLTEILRQGAHQMLSAAKKWRLLNGSNLLPDVIAGIQFIDVVKPQEAAA